MDSVIIGCRGSCLYWVCICVYRWQSRIRNTFDCIPYSLTVPALVRHMILLFSIIGYICLHWLSRFLPMLSLYLWCWQMAKSMDSDDGMTLQRAHSISSTQQVTSGTTEQEIYLLLLLCYVPPIAWYSIQTLHCHYNLPLHRKPQFHCSMFPRFLFLSTSLY